MELSFAMIGYLYHWCIHKWYLWPFIPTLVQLYLEGNGWTLTESMSNRSITCFHFSPFSNFSSMWDGSRLEKKQVVCRDVIALLKSEGAHLYLALFSEKTGGAQSTFYLNVAKKLGAGPPGPLGDYIPVSYTYVFQVNFVPFRA